MRYTLRPTQPDDFDFLYRLRVACLKEYVAAVWGWDEAFQRRHFATRFDPTASQIIMACGRDVGQLSVEFRPDEVYLSAIYILPAYQGQGIGSQIISNLLAVARDRDQPMSLQVIIGNPARRLYRRLGFNVVGYTMTHFLMRADPQP